MDGVEAIQERLRQYDDTRQSALVLDPSLLVMAATLLLEAFEGWDGQDGVSVDLGKVYVVARLHLARLGVLEPALRAADTVAAARLLELVGRADPDVVPEGARAAVEQVRRRDADEHPSPIAECLLGDAIVLRETFDRTGSFSCLDISVTLFRGAVDTSSLTHLPRYLKHLGAALALRASETGAIADWDAAISVSKQAVAEVEVLTETKLLEEAEMPAYLAFVGLMHRMRFEETGRQEDRDAGIQSYRAAIEAAKNMPSLRAQLSAELDDIVGV